MCPIRKEKIDHNSEEISLTKIKQERDPRNSATSLKDRSEYFKYLKNLGY